jgi:hypothetical protein
MQEQEKRKESSLPLSRGQRHGMLFHILHLRKSARSAVKNSLAFLSSNKLQRQ